MPQWGFDRIDAEARERADAVDSLFLFPRARGVGLDIGVGAGEAAADADALAVEGEIGADFELEGAKARVDLLRNFFFQLGDAADIGDPGDRQRVAAAAAEKRVRWGVVVLGVEVEQSDIDGGGDQAAEFGVVVGGQGVVDAIPGGAALAEINIDQRGQERLAQHRGRGCVPGVFEIGDFAKAGQAGLGFEFQDIILRDVFALGWAAGGCDPGIVDAGDGDGVDVQVAEAHGISCGCRVRWRDRGRVRNRAGRRRNGTRRRSGSRRGGR